ncbi:hypothetical protein [Raoultella terrigena]|uniref:hypothetical protein n=1 Tax=Raoultella terrigena TaxID=577 RepID=UPI0011D23409|nr:hypothetical protein [Raoultella terrigena]
MSAEYIAYESLVATRAAADWAFWSMIGSWVSGVATFLAVVVSLYLANRRSRPVLNISVDWCFISGGYQTISGIGITVANAADTNIVITSIAWEMGSSKKLAQMFDHSFSEKMPKKLASGESAMFFIENDQSNGWLHALLKNIRQNNGKVDKLTVCVSLASGIKKRKRAKVLSAALRELNATK